MTVNEIMKDMEAKQRYQFYMLTLLRQTQKQSILDGNLWPFPKNFSCFDRYNITIEAIVKANEEPHYETHRWIMADQTFPVDLWIRKGTLKNELLITKLSEEAFGEKK